MTPDEAIVEVQRRFPIEGYVAGNLAPWRTVGEVVNRHLEPGDRLFDLGSGACDKTAVAQIMGIDCTATDDLRDDWHLRDGNVERIEKFAADTGIDFSRQYQPPRPETYDMVMMNDVLEHIHDSPRDLLNDLVSGLKPGGLLFITVPNIANIRKRIDLIRGRTNLPRYDLYYWYRGPWRGPQREYTRGDLESMCGNLGVEIVELRTVHHMLENLPARLHGPYKAITAVFPDWRDTWLLIARRPQDWAPKRDISEQEFAAIYRQKGSDALYERSA